MVGLASTQLLRAYDHYLDMPGLRLTEQQARRLWGLDDVSFTQVLNQLIELRLIEVDGNGRYRQTVEGAAVAPKLRMAKVPDPDAWKTLRRTQR
jgi:hypothetical protein